MANPLRLGIFLVTTLAMLAVGSFLIGDRQFLFSSTYQLETTFKTVDGLTEGADVRVGGIHKGIVKHIELPADPNGRMTVVMKLERSAEQVVRSDSVASLGTEGLLGNKFVEISFGSERAPALGAGGTIASAPPVDLMKQASASLGQLSDISMKVGTEAGEGAAAFKDNMEALKHNFLLRGFFTNRGYEDSTRLRDDLIDRLPKAATLQSFHYDVKKIFVDVDHAKLKSERTMNEVGRFLEQTPFGLAVVVASSGMKGDSADLEVMLQARAMVIRDYLVKTFRMDDTRVKTMTQAKDAGPSTDDGTIDIVVFPSSVHAPKSAASPDAAKTP